MSALSRDTPVPGLVVLQPRGGFRYSMEPFLLAGWLLEAGHRGPFVDVGAGSGILALLLASQGLAGEGIDVLPDWVALARRSLEESRRADGAPLDLRFRVQDVRDRCEPPVPLVVCNPPFFPLGSGPVSANPFRAAARHEQAGTLAELVAAMARAGSVVALVLSAGRGEEGARALAAAGRPVARRCELDDTFVLLEGEPDGGPCEHRRERLFEGDGPGPAVRRWYELLGARLALAPRGNT